MLKIEDQFTHNRETEAWENQNLPPQEVRQCLQSSQMEDTQKEQNGQHTKRASKQTTINQMESTQREPSKHTTNKHSFLLLENTQKRHTTKAEREINLDAYNWVIWKTYLLEKSHPSRIYLDQRGATIGFSSPGAAPLLGKIQTFNRAQLEW